ncbi:Uma2 family endonuclease [Sodalinema gerasimenkoae]|uniref:Uma2 family endonuclease n=1 Tax=Sodalinema gerasimenkoae TaxID=2862348 RepID=UPI001358A191|nr:Uma2 family endonuclease [Sodalinema gerasimenkoae]
MAIATAPISTEPTYTAEDYLQQEVQQETRNEYRNGEIVPMSGGTPAHNEIVSVLNALLRWGLRGQPYSIFVTDQRLWIPQRNTYTYPDVMVTGKPCQLQAGRNDTVINPIVLAEVLSPSTQNYDRSEKFVAYRTLDTVQDYLLIHQDRPQVEHYVKQKPQQWLLTDYEGLDATLALESLSLTLSLRDLYEAVDFQTSVETPPTEDNPQAEETEGSSGT